MHYWGTREPYVKRNQLLGFVEQIGHDVGSIESILQTYYQAIRIG